MQFLKTPTPRLRSPTPPPAHTTTTTPPLSLFLSPSHLCSFTILYYSLDVNFQQVFNDDDENNNNNKLSFFVLNRKKWPRICLHV